MSGQQERAAKRYSRAIFDVVEPSQHDTLTMLLDGLSSTWKTTPEFRSIISEPTVKTDDKVDVVRKIVDSFGLHLTDPMRSFVALLVTTGRLPLISVIRDDVTFMVREFRKALSIKITSAAEIPAEERESITQALRTKLNADVGAEWGVDPTIIGGLVIKLGDKLLDRSIAGMLQQMKSHITA